MFEVNFVSGEDCRSSTQGIFFMNTNSAPPFAIGRLTDFTRTKVIKTISFGPVRDVDPFLKEIDTFGKLEGNFNNLPYKTPSNHDNDVFFQNKGSNKLAHNFVDRLRNQADEQKETNFINGGDG